MLWFTIWITIMGLNKQGNISIWLMQSMNKLQYKSNNNFLTSYTHPEMDNAFRDVQLWLSDLMFGSLQQEHFKAVLLLDLLKTKKAGSADQERKQNYNKSQCHLAHNTALLFFHREELSTHKEKCSEDAGSLCI